MPKVLGFISLMFIVAIASLAFTAPEYDEDALDVIYEVKCSQCNVNYRNLNGDTEKITDVEGTWDYAFTGSKGQFIYVAATNKDGSETKVQIKRGGRVVVVGTSKDPSSSARAGIIL